MENDIEHIKRRVHRYWFVDGLAELSLGLFCIFLSLMFYLWSVVPEFPLINLTFYLVIFGSGYVARWVLRTLKEHTIYPRTGYVDYKSGWKNKRILAIAFGFTLLLAALIYLSGTVSFTNQWMPAIGGLIFTFIFVMVGFQTSWKKFYLLGIFCMLAGCFVSIRGYGDKLGVVILSSIVGGVLLTSGLLRRRHYLRQV